MKARGLGGILSVICIVAIVCISGCAMNNSQIMKTDKGESIVTDRLINDTDFYEHRLIKVALERNEENSFYGLQATYMNEVAFVALVSGIDFPDSSKISLVFFNFSDVNGVVSPGKKMWSATMKKTRAEKTGNWEYSSIDYQISRPKFPDPVDTCYVKCHMTKKSNDYVFLEHPLNPHYEKQK